MEDAFVLGAQFSMIKKKEKNCSAELCILISLPRRKEQLLKPLLFAYSGHQQSHFSSELTRSQHTERPESTINAVVVVVFACIFSIIFQFCIESDANSSYSIYLQLHSYAFCLHIHSYLFICYLNNSFWSEYVMSPAGMVIVSVCLNKNSHNTTHDTRVQLSSFIEQKMIVV